MTTNITHSISPASVSFLFPTQEDYTMDGIGIIEFVFEHRLAQ